MAQRITNDFAGSIVGSVFTKASSDAIIPPTGHVFIGFTVLSAATFDATGGLIAYTATQFALLASIGTAGRTLFASSSGSLVDWLNGDWGIFFIITAVMVVPSLIFLYLIKDKLKLND